MGRGGPNGPSSLLRLRLQSSDSNRPCRHHFGRLFSFQTEKGMCLGKIMGLGLVYSLPSAFLGSNAAIALHWMKKRPGRDAVGGFGV